jgi:hypothetical protein
MIRALMIALLCLATPLQAQLMYPPPPMAADAETIQLTTGAQNLSLDLNKDYYLIPPKVPKVGPTIINGGRNVIMRGGHFKTTPTGQKTRVLYIVNGTGTVHLEGLLISCEPGVQFDAIAINKELGNVAIQRANLCSYGTRAIYHGDVVQVWGGVKKLWMDRFTIRFGYQGLQLPATEGPWGYGWFSNGDLTGFGADAAFGIWAVRGATTCLEPQHSSWTNVWIDGPQRPNKLVWPWTEMPTACPSKITGNVLTFHPSLTTLTGQINIGVAPKVNAPVEKVGLNYNPADPFWQPAPAPTPDPVVTPTPTPTPVPTGITMSCSMTGTAPAMSLVCKAP